MNYKFEFQFVGAKRKNHIDKIKLYEDLARELITEKRFQMLSAGYDSEQEEQNSISR